MHDTLYKHIHDVVSENWNLSAWSCALLENKNFFSVRIRNIIVDLLVIHHTDRSPSLQFYMSLGPGAPLTYFNDGGVRTPKDFLGSDILAKRDFFGSMKDAEIFLGRENIRGIFWGIVFFISSNQK